MKKVFEIVFLTLVMHTAFAQQPLHSGKWRGFLHREDGKDVVFNFEVLWMQRQPVFFVTNASERIKITDITVKEDSILFKMPVFESEFKAQILSKDSISGVWIKGTSAANQVISFTATDRQPYRFKTTGNTAQNISGKWSVTFKKDGYTSPAIAVFTQKGHRLTGSFVTPTGDDRFLEGVVNKDSIWLSTFDGVHALLFTATIANKKINGMYYSGAKGKESWTAVRNDTATLPDIAAMHLKDSGNNHLNFTFSDLDGKPVSINDTRFKNKVVVIQLMGSWCPNCLDETAFLSNWYKKNHQRGIEVIGLAYEYTTNFDRSQKSLRKFQQRFNVPYPMLITGVSTADSLKTEKTLPQLTDIKTFPTTIFLGKNGTVQKIETDFAGPGTGEYYERFKQEFDNTIDTLLNEH